MKESRRRARFYAPGFILLAQLLASCGGDVGPGAQPRALPATATYHLSAMSDDPVGPLIMLDMGDSGAVGFDVPTAAAWFFATDTARGFHKIRELEWLNSGKVMVAALWHDTLALLDKRGNFVRTVLNDPAAAVNVVPLKPRVRARPLSMHRLPAGGRWIYSNEYAGSADDGFLIDSIVISMITDSGRVATLVGLEKAGPERPTVLLTNYMSTSSRGDTVWIAGSDPPRVYTWMPGDTTLGDPITLDDIPKRPVPARERRDLQRSLGLRSAAILARARIPRYYPPVVAVRPMGNATLVVAGAGETATALDLYCDNKFKENLAFSPSILQITLTDSGVWIQEAAEDGSEMILSFAPAALLTADCRTE